MNLSGADGIAIVESLGRNISLTNFDYSGNAFDMPFKQGIEKELDLNE